MVKDGPPSSGFPILTRLVLSDYQPGTVFRNIFTDEILTAETFEGETVLNLADITRNFPVALLERLRDVG